ncbi:GNAT family N-acetyltransferase [Clostridioides difficile]
MRVEFLKAKDSDYDELVDFANYVFSHSGEKTDFPSLLPKLYKKEYNTMKYHYIVKEDGKIKAIVGSFPMEINVLGEVLKISGIGTVSVHPYSRGSGYMKKLMNMALQDMKDDGIHISCLGGRRQRYEYFSYTPCGQKIGFYINEDNVNHKLKKLLNDNIAFEEIIDNDLEAIEKAYNIYNENKVKVIREKCQFIDILKSWNSKVYSIMKNKEFIGYVVVSEDRKVINEIVITNENEFLEVLSNYINQNNIEEVNLSMPLWEKDKIKILQEICEGSLISNSHQFNIINYEEVLKVLLKLKASYTKLQDGTLSINIKDYGNIKINVKDNNITTLKSQELDKQENSIEATHLKAMQILFSPLGRYLIENEDLEFVSSWLPLPLHIPVQDNV